MLINFPNVGEISLQIANNVRNVSAMSEIQRMHFLYYMHYNSVVCKAKANYFHASGK